MAGQLREVPVVAERASPTQPPPRSADGSRRRIEAGRGAAVIASAWPSTIRLMPPSRGAGDPQRIGHVGDAARRTSSRRPRPRSGRRSSSSSGSRRGRSRRRRRSARARRRGRTLRIFVRTFASFASRASAGEPGRRQDPELARDVAAVDVGVVVPDQIVGDGQHVAALDLDPARRWARSPGTSPGPANVPVARQRTAVRLRYGRQVEDLEREVGERVEQRREVRADAVGRDQVLLADEPVDRAGRPQRGGGVEVVGGRARRSTAWRYPTVEAIEAAQSTRRAISCAA